MRFATKFAQRCVGHDYGHSPIEGGKVVSDAAFYPKKFCQRVVQLWKASDESTPRKILKKCEEAREAEETDYTCDGCNSTNPIPTCPNCEPEEAMPAVHELMRDIPEDDEGNVEKVLKPDYSACAATWDTHRTGYLFKY